MADRKRVSTTVVRCRECEFDDMERYAVVIVYQDGDVEVCCSGDCSPCKYERLKGGSKGVTSPGAQILE